MENLLQNLEQFGLKANEAKVFLSLLKLSEASPNRIAEEAGIERTTVYKILDILSDKGLVSKNIKGKRLTYVSKGSKAIEGLLSRQKSILSGIMPLLLALENTDSVKPRVEFYDNIEAIKAVYNRSLCSEEKIRRDFISIQGITDLLGQRFIQNHTNLRVKKNISVKAIRSYDDKQSELEKDWLLKSTNTETMREVKYLKNISFESTIVLFDQTVLIISAGKNPFALVIESTDLSKTVKVLFDIAWEKAL